jgi:5S rRNA maturation endonuclease (ribonuclease M5)
MIQSTSKMIPREEINRLKSVAEEHSEEVFDRLDITHSGPCPIHGGDNRRAFLYDECKGIWSCFTHGCQHQHGNDIVGLIGGVLNCSFRESLEWIKTHIVDAQSIDVEQYSGEPKPIRVTPNAIISDKFIGGLNFTHIYMQERGIDEGVAKFFECGVNLNGPSYKHRLMFPIRNIKGELVGINGRSIYPECEACDCFHTPNEHVPEKYWPLYAKYLNFPREFKKSQELYNIQNAKKLIRRNGVAILTEGTLDCINMFIKGFENTVATLGSSFSREQAKILSKCGCHTLIVCYDNDEAGGKATSKIYEKFNSQFTIIRVELPKGVDPGTASEEQLHECIGNGVVL